MIRALIVLVLGACTQQQPPPGAAGPAEAVQQFAAALQKGDTGTAWALLSRRTQAKAQELAAKAQPDAGAEAGRQMLFNSALPGRPVEARQISINGDSAEVQTSEDGGAQRTWRVLREGGRWRIDLDLGR